jgi:hypothetical protein
MAKHTLSLNIPTILNDCIIRIEDTSVYATGLDGCELPIECPQLYILPPGFSQATSIDVTPNFVLNLNACDLSLQTSGCGTQMNSLPDGVYVIRYSIAPNDYVYVEYNHLRITNALIKYNELLCELDVAACNPLQEVQDKLQELRLIRMLLDAAKAKVEFCHNPSAGMDLYEYAKKRLDKMDCTVCI